MMSVDASKIEVGSAAWLGTEEYESDSEFHQRAVRFLEDVNWGRLTEICTERRQGIRCQLAPNFSIGHFNMVRKVVFEDGQSWIVRLRMPDLENEGGPIIQDVKRLLSSEVACMRFLRRRSSIPVPEVYHYELEHNDVGPLYIAMEYIPGTVASELQGQIDAGPFQFGSPEQDQAFRRRMAAIQAEMASLTIFDKIGSLYQGPDTEDFYIGPDCETGEGPWDSSIEYYRHLANEKLEQYVQCAPSEVDDDASFALPVLFGRLIEMYADEESNRGPFGFAHRDFGAHNLLVNENFEILAVIDFDGFMTAPIEMQAQFPCLTGLDTEPPFHVETMPMAIKRIEETRPKLAEYKRMIQECEEKEGKALDQRTLPGDLMQSDAAAIVLGLADYGMHQKRVNQKWMLSFSRLLLQKVVSNIEGKRKPRP